MFYCKFYLEEIEYHSKQKHICSCKYSCCRRQKRCVILLPTFPIGTKRSGKMIAQNTVNIQYDQQGAPYYYKRFRILARRNKTIVVQTLTMRWTFNVCSHIHSPSWPTTPHGYQDNHHVNHIVMDTWRQRRELHQGWGRHTCPRHHTLTQKACIWNRAPKRPPPFCTLWSPQSLPPSVASSITPLWSPRSPCFSLSGAGAEYCGL